MSFERCNTNRTRLPLSCPLFRPGNTTSLVSGQDTLEAAFVVPYVCELRRLTFVTSSTPECHLTRLTVRYCKTISRVSNFSIASHVHGSEYVQAPSLRPPCP